MSLKGSSTAQYRLENKNHQKNKSKNLENRKKGSNFATQTGTKPIKQ